MFVQNVHNDWKQVFLESLCTLCTNVPEPHNLEEKHVTDCIGPAAQRIVHVHISENDRGTPGKGHIDWTTVLGELKSAGYDGWLTIESFSRALPQLAAATRIWRDLSPSLDEVWQEGFTLIRKGWDTA